MKKIVFVFIGFGLISCSTQNVAVDYDRQQDFSQLRDYRMEFVDDSSDNELLMGSIRMALQNELSTKGMNYNANSDVLIKIQPNEYITQTRSSNVGIGVGSSGRNFGGSMHIGIPINTQKLNQDFKVSIYNTQNHLVWDSKLSIRMPANASPETAETNIQKGVRKLFKNYPPTGK